MKEGLACTPELTKFSAGVLLCVSACEKEKHVLAAVALNELMT